MSASNPVLPPPSSRPACPAIVRRLSSQLLGARPRVYYPSHSAHLCPGPPPRRTAGLRVARACWRTAQTHGYPPAPTNHRKPRQHITTTTKPAAFCPAASGRVLPPPIVSSSHDVHMTTMGMWLGGCGSRALLALGPTHLDHGQHPYPLRNAVALLGRRTQRLRPGRARHGTVSQ